MAATWRSQWTKEGIARSTQAIAVPGLVHLLAFFIGEQVLWSCSGKLVLACQILCSKDIISTPASSCTPLPCPIGKHHWTLEQTSTRIGAFMTVASAYQDTHVKAASNDAGAGWVRRKLNRTACGNGGSQEAVREQFGGAGASGAESIAANMAAAAAVRANYGSRGCQGPLGESAGGSKGSGAPPSASAAAAPCGEPSCSSGCMEAPADQAGSTAGSGGERSAATAATGGTGRKAGAPHGLNRGPDARSTLAAASAPASRNPSPAEAGAVRPVAATTLIPTAAGSDPASVTDAVHSAAATTLIPAVAEADYPAMTGAFDPAAALPNSAAPDFDPALVTDCSPCGGCNTRPYGVRG